MRMSANYDGDLQQYVRNLVLENMEYQRHQDRGVEDTISRQTNAGNDNAKRGDNGRVRAPEAQQDE